MIGGPRNMELAFVLVTTALNYLVLTYLGLLMWRTTNLVGLSAVAYIAAVMFITSPNFPAALIDFWRARN